MSDHDETTVEPSGDRPVVAVLPVPADALGHMAVVIDRDEIPLATLQVRAGRTQLEELLAWSASFDDRVWAIESANGLGYLLGQQLVGAGERVLEVPATFSARVRVLATSRRTRTIRTTRCRSRSLPVTRRASVRFRPLIIRWCCGWW